MDESLTTVFITAIVFLLAIIYGAVLLWSEAKFRGWCEGRQENELYHRHEIYALNARIVARENALAMYRDISTTFCHNMSGCMRCPYDCDKNDKKCALWELNEKVERFGIKEVHVDTKHDGGDCYF